MHGSPIIEHVVNMFPGEHQFTFICREEHLESTNMKEVLTSITHNPTIIALKESSLGPVYAVAAAFDQIDDTEPVIISYCDYFMNWDYADFKKNVAENGCDASVPAYSGFHPHLLHEKNLYASMRVDENGYMEEIREKFSFTEDKTQSPQSPGVFYFKSGALVKKYFQSLMDREEKMNGEYYVSLIFNEMKNHGLKIFVYDKIPHFLQWGTPEDLGEYEAWVRYFEHAEGKGKSNNEIPEAGERFVVIPHAKDSPEYQKSYEYWKAYFEALDSYLY